MGSKKIKKEQKFSKKEFNKDIRKKIEVALADFREELGEKEFAARVKKASKLFSRGVKQPSKTTEPEKSNIMIGNGTALELSTPKK